MSRPELTGHASQFYNEREAKKYDSSSRMITIQREITNRAIELCLLHTFIDREHRPAYVLDIGCGTGLSGQVLEENGSSSSSSSHQDHPPHIWVGCDISRDMLHVAQDRIHQSSYRHTKKKKKKNSSSNNNNKSETGGNMKTSSDDDDNDNDDSDDDDDDNDEQEDDDDEEVTGESMGDLIHHDMGTGLPFRPATFDACISISALQWLCYSNTKDQNPKQRLVRFFSSLYTVLKRNGRAVLQFYPETSEQAVLISETATSCGFTGGIVVDYPNSAKAKKHYLVLHFDRSNIQKKGTIDATSRHIMNRQQQQSENVSVGGVAVASSSSSSSKYDNRGMKKNGKGIVVRKGKYGTKTKEWILHKKETERNRGKVVRPDTKYTARKRPAKF